MQSFWPLKDVSIFSNQMAAIFDYRSGLSDAILKKIIQGVS